MYNNERRIDNTIKKENHILWKKFNFILTYKNNKSSLFSYTSFINKSKITVNLKDLLAPYTTEYTLDFTCNDFLRELDIDDGYATFEDIENAITLLLQSYISGLNYED
jgi:hypothetical protein